MPKIPTRWEGFGTSIFTLMTEESLKCNAINLSQGFPDFDGPPSIKEAAITAIREGRNQYAPSAGILPLRAGLAKLAKKRYGLEWDPMTEITVFSGATEAIFCTILGLCQPGDEVVTFEPFYDSYPPSIMAAGASLKGVLLRGPEWHFDEAELRAAVTPRTKAILLNTPNNPTGKVFTRQELEVVSRIAIEKDLFVITDEVYEELVFDGRKHIPISTVPGMKDRTVTISSTSKTFSMTGWKIGFAYASPRLTSALRAVHQFSVFCSATPLQWGMVNAVDMDDRYFTEFRMEYQTKRDHLHQILSDVGFTCKKSQGTYFIVADYGNLSSLGDLDFSLWMTRNVGVSCVPITSFCTDQGKAQVGNYVRFAFCKGMPTLEAAREKLKKASFSARQ